MGWVVDVLFAAFVWSALAWFVYRLLFGRWA